MTASEYSCFHIAGTLLGCTISEVYSSPIGAINRLKELTAAANDIAEGDPRTRIRMSPRFVLTDAAMPDLMDAFTGETLVGILEQFPLPCARKDRSDDPA